MKALRVQVERVVRPIRASNACKDRMREELLAHLTRLYEEELARTGDVELATTEAMQRFGDGSALTSELQEGVPWLESLAFFKFPALGPMKRLRRRPEESPFRYLLRTNCWGSIIGIACYSLIAFAAIAISSRRPHRADQVTGIQAFIVLAGTAAIQLATILGWGLLSEGIRQELERHAATKTTAQRRQSAWRIVAFAAAGSALLGGAAAGLMLLVEAFAPVAIVTRSGFWWVTCGALALGPLAVLLHGRELKASERRFETWESLDLDERRVA